jgi:hypothetical protein
MAAAILAGCSDADVTAPQSEVLPPSLSTTDGDFHSSPDLSPDHGGSHFRLGHLNWRKVGPRTAEFTYVLAFRRSAFGFPGPVLNQLLTLGVIRFGDGTQATPQFRVTFVDAANDWFEARSTFTHLYPTAGIFTAESIDCCRIGIQTTPGWAHINNPDHAVRYHARVDFAYEGNAVSTLPPLVTCQINAPCSFNVTAAIPAGQTVLWRLANTVEMGDPSSRHPAAANGSNPAQVNPLTGVYSWNTTGATVFTGSPPRITVYSTQVVMDGLNPAGQVVTRSIIDFLIRLSNEAQNAAPVFVAPTPADGSSFTLAVGQPLSLQLAATDPNAADVVTISSLGAPTGAILSAVISNPASATFSWTPSAAQAGTNHVITFVPTDSRALSGAQRTISIAVTANRAPVATITGVSSTAEGTTVTIDGSDSFDPDEDPLTYAWTINGAPAGSGPSVTYNAEDGPATVVFGLTVTDDHGESSSASHTLEVVDVPPSVVMPPSVEVYHGDSYAFSASMSDPGADAPWTYTLSFGDPSAAVTGAASPASPITGGHVYAELGEYTVTLVVTDKDGVTGSGTTTVKVVRRPARIDYKPFLQPNVLYFDKDKSAPVAIISDGDLTATTMIRLSTVTGGDGVGSETLAIQSISFIDVNADGKLDAIVTFSMPPLKANGDITLQSTEIIVRFTDQSGRHFEGKDIFTVVAR